MEMEYDKPKKKTYELAGIGTRFIALIIDAIILGVLEGILLRGAGPAGGLGGLAIGAVYQWYFLTRNNGQTPGKALLGIRVIKADGTPLQDADAIIRYIGYYINMFFMLGWIWAVVDTNNQGWHDKLAKTYVVVA